MVVGDLASFNFLMFESVFHSSSRGDFWLNLLHVLQIAKSVLSAVFNSECHPTGFRVRSSVIAVSFCHENSFVPIYAASEWSFKGEGGQQLIYWDTKAFVNAWSPSIPKPSVVLITADKTSSAQDLTREKKETADDDMEAFFSSIEAEVPALAATKQSAEVSGTTVSASLNVVAPVAQVAVQLTKEIKTPAQVTPPDLVPVVSLPSVSVSDVVSPMNAEDLLKASLKARKSSREGGAKKTKDNDLIETKKVRLIIQLHSGRAGPDA